MRDTRTRRRPDLGLPLLGRHPFGLVGAGRAPGILPARPFGRPQDGLPLLGRHPFGLVGAGRAPGILPARPFGRPQDGLPLLGRHPFGLVGAGRAPGILPARPFGRPQDGLTLVEILVSIAVFGIAAAGLFAGFQRVLAAAVAAEDRLIAANLAYELAAEVRLRALVDPDTAVPVVWGREADETGEDRSLFDDMDDYDGLEEAPPRDPVGNPRADLAGWSRRVEVRTVRAEDPTQEAEPGSTPLRLVRITVLRAGAVAEEIAFPAAGR